MVFCRVSFTNDRLDKTAHKNALKMLAKSLPMTDKKRPERALTQNEFITFKRMTELYLKTLKLVVNVPRQFNTGNKIKRIHKLQLQIMTQFHSLNIVEQGINDHWTYWWISLILPD